jgi:hypothetical protein
MSDAAVGAGFRFPLIARRVSPTLTGLGKVISSKPRLPRLVPRGLFGHFHTDDQPHREDSVDQSRAMDRPFAEFHVQMQGLGVVGQDTEQIESSRAPDAQG